MNAQTLPDHTLFQQVDLFIIQTAVTGGILFDVFQREGNVSDLVCTHACACVRSGLVSIAEVCVDVNTVGCLALHFHNALIKG